MCSATSSYSDSKGRNGLVKIKQCDLIYVTSWSWSHVGEAREVFMVEVALSFILKDVQEFSWIGEEIFIKRITLARIFKVVF